MAAERASEQFAMIVCAVDEVRTRQHNFDDRKFVRDDGVVGQITTLGLASVDDEPLLRGGGDLDAEA
jgi:hypothetical protein